MAISYRHRYFREVFTNAVLHDGPEVQFVMWLWRDAGTPLGNWGQVLEEAWTGTIWDLIKTRTTFYKLNRGLTLVGLIGLR